MPTREVQYASGEPGYNAMVADITEMFNWDAVTPVESSSGNYTSFRKDCGADRYVSLRMGADLRVGVSGFNGVSEYAHTPATSALSNVTYAYGDGFFVMTRCSSPPPQTDGYYAGVSTGRNIITGETGWVSFINMMNGSYSSSFITDYMMFSKDSKAAVRNANLITYNSKIGAAVSLHETATGWVSDKVLHLNALPDNFLFCLTNVVFNGVPYIRLGQILVPAE